MIDDLLDIKWTSDLTFIIEFDHNKFCNKLFARNQVDLRFDFFIKFRFNLMNNISMI